MRLAFDLETRSEADIEEVGAWNYSRHPSTRVLCGAFTNEDGNVTCYDLTSGQRPKEWELAVANGWEIWADNSSFEYSIITNVLPHWPQPKVNMWRDFQWIANSAARPAKLETRAKALGLVEQKDTRGKALINFFCKPIASGGKKGQFRDPVEHPERFAELMAYCKQDVITSVATGKALRPLSDAELAFFLNTWRMNIRGVHIDTDLVRALISMTDTSRKLICDKLESETGFASVDLTNHKKVLEHVKGTGVVCDSVAKAAVKKTLAEDIPEEARVVLEARQAIGKTSVAKLPALLSEVGDDGRLRFIIRPHGSYTGRDSGMGVQPQNLPRGEKGLKPDALITAVVAGDTQGFLDQSWRTSGGKRIHDPMGAIAACIRGCFVAAPGKTLIQCDWASIEPRIAAWLVGDEELLDVFRKFDTEGGPDLYQMFVASFTGMDPHDVKGDWRQMGKVGELLTLYEGGERTLQKSAKDVYGLDLTIDQCVQLKDVWRAKHPKHVAFWRSLNDGAIAACRLPKTVYRVGRVALTHDGRDLRLRLPCGRVITYPDATVKPTLTPWGKYQDQVNFYCVLNGHWMEDSLHGGAIFNSCVQGTGASIMRNASINLEAAGFDVVMRVHDELIAEVESESRFAEFKRIMLTPPPWALDLPINGAGWTGPRYRKD